ncbi:hypothetical protein N2152v2_000440 [Parachlorella kessleri]
MAGEPTCTLALDAKCNLGESPVWDDRTGTVYFVDINENTIHAFRPEDGTHQKIVMSEHVATIVPTSDPKILLAALSRDIVEVDVAKEDMRFNDGKVSPQGVLVVGRMHSKWRDGKAGRLYRLDPGSSELVEVMGPSEVHLPNGIAWDEGKGIIYYIDSGAETVVAYKADGQGLPVRGPDGKLQGRTLVTVNSGHATVPDGMTIDTDGNLWVALGESGCVVCYSAETGEELRRVRLPVQRPTACTFGGPELQHLYVTTRVESGEGASPHHGGLFQVDIPGVRGVAPAYIFPLAS